MENVEEVSTENLNEEELVEASDEKTETPKDYKIILDMIKEMEDQFNTMTTTLESTMKESYGLSKDVLGDVLPYKKEDIQDMRADDVREFLLKHSITMESRKAYMENSEDEIKKVMDVVKDASLLILSSKTEVKKLKDESADVLHDYFTYISSEKVQASRKKRLEVLKNALELSNDDQENKKIEKQIASIEAALSLSFLQDRFVKFGDKEKKSIKEAYFDKYKGSYIIDKYKSKIQAFGFKEKLYQYFFNIEENFLDETYHVYNNLFLFIYMRMVAYSDINNKTDIMWVQSITSALANLIYHKFENTENEVEFIGIIKSVLDNFEEYHEYFKENNTTYPDHPVRKAADVRHEAERKRVLIENMNKMKITGYDVNASADDLQKFFNEKTDEMIESQLAEKEAREKKELEVPEDAEIIDDTEDDVEPSDSNIVECPTTTENQPE